MNRQISGLLLAVALFAGLCGAASGKNYALLIGNSNYSIGLLDNPANDAQDLSNVLRSLGFETTIKLNQSGDGMKNAIREFGDKLKNNDGIGLFFYAGHGVQVNGENYLLPVGFPFSNEQEVEKNGVQANMLLRYMEDSKNRVNVVILDACRNNPFIKTRSLKTRGLAPMDAPSGSLVAFATAPGTEASDGSGRNGLYTKHLMSNVKIPGLTIEQVFKRTREGVENESGRKQSPREESSLKGGDMYFVPPLSQTASGASAEQVELAYWNSIANSSNPADFDAYLSQYPQGKFAELARNRAKVTKMAALAGRNEARTLGDEHSSQPKLALVKPGRVHSGPGSFTFDDDAEAPIKAAEFISISCRDFIKNKRVELQLEERGSQGAQNNAFRRSLEQRLQSLGVRVAAVGSAADLVLKGVIETTSSTNPLLGIGAVDLEADFMLQLPSGEALSTATVSGGAFTGSNKKSAVRGVWDEKSEELVGKLFKDYCTDH